jgi:hypothetical protein
LKEYSKYLRGFTGLVGRKFVGRRMNKISCGCGGFPTAGGICTYVSGGKVCTAPVWFECRFKTVEPDWKSFSEWVLDETEKEYDLDYSLVRLKALECGLLERAQ